MICETVRELDNKLMVLVTWMPPTLSVGGLAAFPTEVGHPESRIGKASRETSTKG